MKNENFPIDFPTEIIQEGEVKVRVPKLDAFVKSPSEYAPSKAPVFYNPVMELNRDIAVLALQAYQKMLNREISVCEPLTGCGIRGIRFATEVEGVKKVVINDINEKAYQLASHNVCLNELSKHITVKNEDANFLLASYGAPRKRFDAIDIDPFGAPVTYLDSAIRALRNGGLLMLTATDMAPLCGIHPKACIRKYGGKPLRTEYCKELAVRLLAGGLAMTAAKYGMGINIIFSYSTDHYIRIYAVAKYGAKRADENIRNMGYIFHCLRCLHRESMKELFALQDCMKCGECGSKMDVTGPLWLGEIINADFCRLMETVISKRPLRQGWEIRRLLALVRGEADSSVTYYVLDTLCKKLALPVPSVENVIDKLRKRGFQAVRTHFETTGIKTNTSLAVIEETIKEALS